MAEELCLHCEVLRLFDENREAFRRGRDIGHGETECVEQMVWGLACVLASVDDETRLLAVTEVTNQLPRLVAKARIEGKYP
jgi:hypothetical protein